MRWSVKFQNLYRSLSHKHTELKTAQNGSEATQCSSVKLISWTQFKGLFSNSQGINDLHMFMKHFEFRMIKSFSFIVSTPFFHFNELKILRQPAYLLF